MWFNVSLVIFYLGGIINVSSKLYSNYMVKENSRWPRIKTKINKNNGKESKVEETTTSSKYKDGTYDGEAKGFGGNIKVSLTVKNDIITEINVVSADKEDSSYLASAKNIINTMLNKQSTDVDTVSGATFSSTGIKNAATIALNKALK